MNSGRTIFAQLMDFVPTYEFRKCVDRYNGNHKVISIPCWDQYLCMAFAQFTYRESLRDIQACLRATQSRLYHLGIRGKVTRNILAHANQTRDWRIYADFAQILIAKARKLYAADSFGIELDQAVYALDSTMPAITIADLYRCRWQVELFFKWIKQHLRIKAFYGTTENAVKTQIWIAISVYVLVAIVKKNLNLDQSLYTILQVLSATIFEKEPIYQVLSNVSYTNQEDYPSNQLNLFN